MPMQLIRGLLNLKKQSGCVLTIGNFDGVHLGHQSVIKKLIKISQSHNFQSALLSFNPHPREFFSTLNEPFNIVTPTFKKTL